MRSKSLLIAGLALGLASTTQAQVSVTPFAGAMIPMQSLLLDTTGTVYFRMSAHKIYGLRVAKAMSPNLGLAVEGGGGSGNLDLLSGGTPFLVPTSFWFIDARARFRLLGGDAANLGAVAGAGWTRWRAALFDAAEVADPDTRLKGVMTGILGLSVRTTLSDRVRLNFDMTDRIHEQPVEAAGILDGFDESLQHDLTFTAGIQLPLGS